MQDVLKCSSEQILDFVTSKLHPGLNKAFAEAGMPFTENQITGQAGKILTWSSNLLVALFAWLCPCQRGADDAGWQAKTPTHLPTYLCVVLGHACLVLATFTSYDWSRPVGVDRSIWLLMALFFKGYDGPVMILDLGNI
jgi:hypothetical protein